MNRLRWGLLPLLILVVVTAVGCSSVDVSTDFDQNFDFAGIKSFAVVQTTSSGSGTPAGVDPLVVQRVQNSVRSVLTEKGLEEDTADKADILVVIHGGSQEQVEVDTGFGYGMWPGWETGGSTAYQYEEGTVVIDMVDGKAKHAIWRGTGEFVQGNNPMTQEQTTATVEKILGTFPPSQKKDS